MKRFLVLVLCLYLAVIGAAVAGNLLIGGERLAALAMSILLLIVAMRYAAARRGYANET